MRERGAKIGKRRTLADIQLIDAAAEWEAVTTV